MKRKIRTLLMISSTAFICGALSLGNLSNVNKDNAFITHASDDVLPEDTFAEKTGEWYTLDAYAYAPSEYGLYDGRADLDILLSPNLLDYSSIDKTSVKDFMNVDDGLVGAIKYILSTQVKFIEPVEVDEVRQTENISSTYNEQRDIIFDKFIKAALSDSSLVDNETFEVEYQRYIDAMEYGVDDSLIKSNGNFIRSVISYLVASGTNGATSAEAIELIKTRLGISNSSIDLNTGLGNALKSIYTRYDSSSNFDSMISSDVETIFEDACKIVNGEVSSPVALAEVFLLLQDTTVPMATMVQIFGEEEIKQAVIDIFTEETISVEVARYMLSNFTIDTCYQLCDCVGFTKDEILNAISNVRPARLMEIAKDLDKHALDNIRIIFGMANDNVDAITKITRDLDHYSYKGQYDQFGQDLVTEVLNNMSLKDMIDSIEALWVGEPGDNYLIYSYNYNETLSDGEPAETGRRLYLHNLLDWINNDFPKMSEIKNRADDKHHDVIHLEIKTPLNAEIIYIDLNIGFQNKDCSSIRNLASILDDAFDLTFDFVEGTNGNYSDNTFSYNLKVRPQYLTNLYEFLCNSGAIFNSEDNRLQHKLFDLIFNHTFGEIKDYLNSDLASAIKSDLKNIDFNLITNTILTFNKFKEMFRNTPASEEDIATFVENLKWIFKRCQTFSYESIHNLLTEIVGDTIAELLDDEAFENFFNDLNNLCNETDVENISIEVLKALTNEQYYSFVDLLEGKEDTLNRIANLAYRIVSVVPSELDDMSLLDFYNNGKLFFDLTNSGEGKYLLNWYDLFNVLPLGNKIYETLDAMVVDKDRLVYGSGTIEVDGNINLNAESSSVHKVSYSYFEDGVDKLVSGLLPEGANLLDFGPATINENEVNYWYNIDNGNKVLLMPNHDITLYPSLKFNATITTDVSSFTYNGTNKANLTVSVDTQGVPYTYQWQYYLDYIGEWINVEGATSTTLTLFKANDEGKYRCIVTNEAGDVVYSNTLSITVSSSHVINFSGAYWNYYDTPFVYDADYHSVVLTNLPYGNGLLYEVIYHNNVNYQSGEYVAYATINVLDPSYKVIYPPICEWKILDPVYYRTFFSTQVDDNNQSLAIITLDSGILENATLNLISDDHAFDNKDVNPSELLGLNGEINECYKLSLTYNYHGTNVSLPISQMSATVSIKIPNGLGEAKPFDIIILDQNGEVKTVDYELSDDGNYAIFHVDSLCQFGFISVLPSNQINWFFIFIILFIIVNIIILISWLIISERRKYNEKLDKKNDAKIK